MDAPASSALGKGTSDKASGTLFSCKGILGHFLPLRGNIMQQSKCGSSESPSWLCCVPRPNYTSLSFSFSFKNEHSKSCLIAFLKRSSGQGMGMLLANYEMLIKF